MKKITKLQEELLDSIIREFRSNYHDVFTDRSIDAMKVNYRENKVEVWSKSKSSSGSKSFPSLPHYESFLDTFSI